MRYKIVEKSVRLNEDDYYLLTGDKMKETMSYRLMELDGFDMSKVAMVACDKKSHNKLNPYQVVILKGEIKCDINIQFS